MLTPSSPTVILYLCFIKRRRRRRRKRREEERRERERERGAGQWEKRVASSNIFCKLFSSCSVLTPSSPTVILYLCFIEEREREREEDEEEEERERERERDV